MAKQPDKTTKANKPNSIAPDKSDAIESLKSDHRAVEQLFASYESADATEKAGLRKQICKALNLHAMLEEEIFYPACRQALDQEDMLDDAQVEHDSAKLLIAELETAEDGEPFLDAKVRVLAEQIRHHIGEEEKPADGIFAKAEINEADMADLTRRLQERRAELDACSQLPTGRPVSLVALFPAAQGKSKESSMPRSQQANRDRDERGRFTSDDDDDRGGRRGSARDDDRAYSSRGSGGRERDDEGRFTSGGRNGGNDGRDGGRGDGRGWYGDSRGHSEAAQRGWDDRGGSRSRDYDDDRGSRSRSGRDDDDRGGRSRGGWFGDSEGHSEASRRGWDNPDHGPSGWFGDSRGHSEASRRGWDDPDHGRSGWYGDSEGHSEAARRGWEDRGGGRNNRAGGGGNSRDDDDRSYRSRSRNDDDDDRDDRARGQGGWFGDSRGHSEAARRGWDNRS